jgi:hypothetical protein
VKYGRNSSLKKIFWQGLPIEARRQKGDFIGKNELFWKKNERKSRLTVLNLQNIIEPFFKALIP